MNITKEQLKAMRQAGRVSFSHKEGTGKIVVTKTLPGKDGYPPSDTSIEIAVDSEARSCIAHGSLPDAVCHHSEHVDCGQVGMFWRTIVTFVKPGDEISLEWGKDYGTNGNMEAAGLHGDRLTLLVKRKEVKYCFIVHSQCCPDNLARMIR